ncbi:putative aryl-alcohol dehydrogenase Aad14 [Hyaloscypha variabilis]
MRTNEILTASIDRIRFPSHDPTLNIWAPAPEPATELGRLRVLSSTAGILVSPLQLGAMSIGSAWSYFMGSMDKETSFDILDAFIEAGGNVIDTANNYQEEESETWIGEWMAARGNRDQLVIATKYTADYRSHEVGAGKTPNSSGNHKRSMYMSIREWLKKLRTHFIDILYVHWWDHTTSIEEIMDSLHNLVQQEKVLYLGISDSPAWVVSAANTYANAHGKTPFNIYQGRWNVMMRDFEREIIPMAPFRNGSCTSQKEVEQHKEAGESLRNLHSGDQTDDEIRMSLALSKVAAEHGIESLTAIALAYVLSKTTDVFPIVGGRKVEHLKDNIQALSIKLSTAQTEYLESVKDLDIGVTGKLPLLSATAGAMKHVQFPKPIGHE